MKLVDANLLLYAYDLDSSYHAPARGWLERTFSEPRAICFCWATLTVFIRIGTNPRAFRHPLSVGEALTIVSDWLAQPSASILNPGEQHWAIFSRLLKQGQASGPLVSDAHLAALAVEHGALLCTTDADFSRFKEVEIFNPLE